MRPIEIAASTVRDIVLVIGLDGRILDANPAAELAYGYTLAELLDLSIDDLRAPITQDRVQAQMVEADRSGVLFESVHRRKDGSVFDCEVSSRGLFLDGKRVLASVVRDITDRKRDEAAVRLGEERFRLLCDATHEGVTLHRNTILLEVNQALLRMTGFERDEMVGHSLFEFMARDEHDDIRRLLREGYEEPQLLTLHCKDGSSRPVQVSGRTLPAADGQLRVTVLRDVQELERTASLLRRTEESFRLLIEHAPLGIVVTDRAQRILYVNAALVRVLGYAATGELVGRAMPELLHPARREEGRRLLAQAAVEGTTPFVDERLLRADGSELTCELIGVAVHFDGQPAVVTSLRDVTATRNLEAQLRQAQKMEAIGRLAGGVAHDFNNILTAILGHSEILGELVAGQTQPKRQAEQIQRAARRAAQLTSQLLAFSRKQVLQPKVLDLNAAVDGMTGMLRRLIGEHLELESALQPALWRVKADPGQIEQVLLNLSVNARDAMPSGGRLVIATRNLLLETPVPAQPLPVPPGRWVQLEVRDSGVGMNAETRARLFEPFFTTKPRGKGTGLGLATVYGIVTQSGGHVTVESEPGEGSRFLVWLPASEEAPAAQARADEIPQRGSETILLVEDDADVRGFLSEVLHNHGYRVVEASDGMEALRVAEGQLSGLDLLLTDVVMPRMGGAELATQLRTLRPALKVLYISGYPGEAGPQRSLFPRDAALLQKPFSIAELARRIREALA